MSPLFARIAYAFIIIHSLSSALSYKTFLFPRVCFLALFHQCFNLLCIISYCLKNWNPTFNLHQFAQLICKNSASLSWQPLSNWTMSDHNRLSTTAKVLALQLWLLYCLAATERYKRPAKLATYRQYMIIPRMQFKI